MKTLGALLAMVVIAGASLLYQLGSRHSTHSSGSVAREPVAGGERAVPTPIVRQPRRSPVPPRSSPPSSAGAEGAASPRLPLSMAEVPLTPKLDQAYQELYKTFGPGVSTWIDGKLARRAALAKCGINEPGAVKFVLRSRVDHQAGTQTIEAIDSFATSYEGEMVDIVMSCIRDAVVGKVEKHVSAVPDWFNDQQRKDWQDSPLDHEIDTVGFPIEADELYHLFKDARASAYQETETKARYGWK